MVTFATVFLGLLLGVQTVGVVVTDPVAAVEIWLDGQRVGVLRGQPWRQRCDFGDELVPHELVAVALGPDGHEIDQVRQWINLPRPPAEADILLQKNAEGVARFARLSWESLVDAPPSMIRVSFDGRPLQVDDPAAIELPSHDPEQLHFLRAELEFPDNVTAVAELGFGGFYAEQVNSQLTAVPVVAEKKTEMPPLQSLQGRFVKEGRPLKVVAIEEGPAEVVVVPDPSAASALVEMARAVPARGSRRPFSMGQISAADRLRAMMPLKEDQRLRFLWPYSERQERTAYDLDLFPSSRQYTKRDGGVLWLLTRVASMSTATGQRLADAVAVAGMGAAARNRRRAVVLVLGDDPWDESQLTPRLARRYLESLRVPLHVWATAEVQDPAWGEVEDASSLGKLERAVKRLATSLERQRIVWIDGVHLPHEVALLSSASDLSLAR